MDAEQVPEYRSSARDIIEGFLTAFQMPQDRAATLAHELVEQLQPTFEDAGRAAAKPLLEALLHYSFDTSEAGEVARQGIKAYLQVCPPFVMPSPEQFTRGIMDMIDQASPEERAQWYELFERLGQRMPPEHDQLGGAA